MVQQESCFCITYKKGRGQIESEAIDYKPRKSSKASTDHRRKAEKVPRRTSKNDIGGFSFVYSFGILTLSNILFANKVNGVLIILTDERDLPTGRGSDYTVSGLELT